jgi:hypothetical protein
VCYCILPVLMLWWVPAHLFHSQLLQGCVSALSLWHCSGQAALYLSLACCHRFLYQQYPKLGAFARKHALPTVGAALHPPTLLCQLFSKHEPSAKAAVCC